MTTLNPDQIKTVMQTRADIDKKIVAEYAEAMKAGQVFPPLDVFFDGKSYLLADGFHRFDAAVKNGAKQVRCNVHRGSKANALEFALGANHTHGLRRTNADKRYAVEIAIEAFGDRSDRAIADLCNVGHPLVAKVREEIEAESKAESGGIYSTCDDETGDSDSETRVGRDGKAYPARPKPKLEAGDQESAEQRSDRIIAAAKRPLLDAIAAFRAARKQVEAISAPARWLSQDAIGESTTDIVQVLNFSMPYELCPHCKGEKCGECLNQGWMPRQVYEGVTERMKG